MELTQVFDAPKVSIADLNVLLKDRKALYDKAQAFRRENEKGEGKEKVLSAEDHGKFMLMLDDVNRMSDKADEMRMELQIQDSMAAITLAEKEKHDDGSPAAQYKKAWMRYVRNGMVDLDAAERKLLQEYGKTDIRAALGIGSGGVGAYTVAEDFYGRVVEVLKAFGGMRAVGAEVLTTSSGADLPVPTGDDTGNVGEIVSESAATLDNADPTFGQVVLKAYTYSSKIVRVHNTLLQDESVGLEGLLARWLVIRIARIQNTHFTSGDDNAKPDGVMHSAQDSGLTTASATEITFDELVSLIHKLDPVYQAGGRFMFHDTVLAMIKKMKTATTLQPLWLPSVAAREPDTIIGKPYTVNQDMPTLAGSAKHVLFGDFSQFFIRDVAGAAMARITERYVEYLQTGFLLFTRADAAVITPSAFKYLNNHA